MLTFDEILTTLQANKPNVVSGAVKLNSTPITGVMTLGPDREVWVIPLVGQERIKVQPEDVLNVESTP